MGHDIAKNCRWCKTAWIGERHDCPVPSTFTLPCFRCGANVKTKPSGYGLTVDFLGPEVRVAHVGYTRIEVMCSEKCAEEQRAIEADKP